jgi:hypothetical protein
MNECYAVGLEVDGYEFSPSDKGDIHLFEVAERGDLRTITMKESKPARSVIVTQRPEVLFVGVRPLGRIAIERHLHCLGHVRVLIYR